MPSVLIQLLQPPVLAPEGLNQGPAFDAGKPCLTNPACDPAGAQPGVGKAPLPAIQVVEVVDLVSSSDSGEGSSSGFSDFVVWDLTKYGSDGGGL